MNTWTIPERERISFSIKKRLLLQTMDRIALFSLLLVLISQLVLPASANAEGDALNAFKSNVADPTNALQSWDPTLPNPCKWGNQVTCNSDNSVIRVDLGNANLTGELVPQLGQLANLEYLELFSNNLSGMIPNELGNLTKLLSLDLYSNRLSGPIPDTLGKLQKLRFLRLNNNSLSGNIPRSLTTIKSLIVIDLSNNMLTGGEITVGETPVNNGSLSLLSPMRLCCFLLIISWNILKLRHLL